MRVQIINEVTTIYPTDTGEWKLCFQWCLYVYDDGKSHNGYRFIWRDPDGNLKPQRGQARISSLKQAIELFNKAIKEGWGEHDTDGMGKDLKNSIKEMNKLINGL
jgi:hypothetical protein